MRRFLLVAGAALSVTGATAAAGQVASPEIRKAYDGAVRCFVANAFVKNRFVKVGDAANAALFEGKAKQAHKIASGYGISLRLSREAMENDFEAATSRELPKLMGNSAYLTETARFCKQESLM